MIVIVMALLGIFVGVTTARRHEGGRLDQLQYGAVFCIAFTLLGLFATVLVERLAG